jgi:hypothetical protein
MRVRATWPPELSSKALDADVAVLAPDGANVARGGALWSPVRDP